jgi:hypothetical protein
MTESPSAKQNWLQKFRKLRTEKTVVRGDDGMPKIQEQGVFAVDVDRPDMTLVPPENWVIDPACDGQCSSSSCSERCSHGCCHCPPPPEGAVLSLPRRLEFLLERDYDRARAGLGAVAGLAALDVEQRVGKFKVLTAVHINNHKPHPSMGKISRKVKI